MKVEKAGSTLVIIAALQPDQPHQELGSGTVLFMAHWNQDDTHLGGPWGTLGFSTRRCQNSPRVWDLLGKAGQGGGWWW